MKQPDLVTTMLFRTSYCSLENECDSKHPMSLIFPSLVTLPLTPTMQNACYPAYASK